MANIKRGTVTIADIKEGDALDYTIKVTGWDLTEKEVAMDVSARHNLSNPVLRFTTEDGSILVTYDDVTPAWQLRFIKTPAEMNISAGNYILDIESYTTADDTQTFADGTMEIVSEVTKRHEV